MRDHHPQKVQKNEGRSGNVYENKGSLDNLPEFMSGICAFLKPIFQKITACDGQFTMIYAFRAQFELRINNAPCRS